ncbi:MAG: response regulator [Pseudomonadota bacterium]
MKILVLEDDVQLRMAFRDALEDAGHSVTAVGSIEDAHERLERRDLDLLLLDLDIDGQCALPIADLARYAIPNAEVIIVTGSRAYPWGELHARAHNVSWSIRKPVALSDLLNVIDFTEHRRLKRSQLASCPNPFGGDRIC